MSLPSRLLAVCFLMPFCAALAAQEGLVTRSHDLRRLVVGAETARQVSFGVHHGPTPVQDVVVGAVRSEDDCLNLVRDFAGVDLAAEGRLARAESGRLEVRCLESEHRSIGRCIEQLGELATVSAPIELHVLPGRALLGGRSRLSPSALAELLRAFPPKASHLGRVLLGQRTAIGSHAVRPWVAGYFAVAAESAVVPDPVPGDLCLGRQWLVQVEPTCDGRFLVQLDGGHAEEGQKRTVRVETAVAAEAATDATKLRLELPDIAVGRVVMGGILRAGEALLFGSDQGDDSALCVVLGGEVAAPTLDGVVALPIGDLIGAMVGGGRALRGLDGRWAGFEPAMGSYVDGDWLLPWLREQLAAGGNVAGIGQLPSRLLVRGSPQAVERVRGVLGELAPRASRQWRLELRYGFLPDAAVAAGVPAVPPVDFGQRCVGLIGERRAFVHERGRESVVFSDQKAEVAIGAGLILPVVTTLWHGGAVEATAMATAGGRVWVDLSLLHVVMSGALPEGESVRGLGGVDCPRRLIHPVQCAFVADVGNWVLVQMMPAATVGRHFVVYLRLEEDV